MRLGLGMLSCLRRGFALFVILVGLALLARNALGP